MSKKQRHEEHEGTLDRRGFLKGAAITGAAAVTAGALAACSPSTGSSTAAADSGSSGGGASNAVSGTIGGAICPEDWLGAPPSIDEANVYETVDVDIVILGGGHVGTQAALSAAQAGASVAVIEAQNSHDYNYFGDDICSYNSQFMINLGFGPYDTGEIVAEYVRRGLGRVSPPIVKLFVENSGEMLDNMVALVPDTSNMLDYAAGEFIVQIAYGKPNGSDYPIEQSGYKAWATTMQTIGTTNPVPLIENRPDMTRLTEIETYVMREAERLGATWYWEHKAAALIGEGNEVTGAYAEGPEGTYLKLNAAKGVLLATGDFSSNPDMVYNLLDDVAEWGTRVGEDRGSLGGPGRDGMGHKLGCWAGGAIEPHPRPSMNTMGGTPGPWGTSAFLTLNNSGKRFMNEAMAQLSSSACLRQPLGLIASITDANFMRTVQGAGLDHGAPNWGYPPIMDTMEADMKNVQPGPEGGIVTSIGIINVGESTYPISFGAPADDEEAPADEGGEEEPAPAGPFAAGPNVWAANTLEELLGYLGYSGVALQTALQNIERYNELCAKGHDDDFNKDDPLMIPINTAPFYGSVTQNAGTTSAGLVTLAGLLTDDQLNVMKADRSGPIKGLYAAGNTLGQRYGMGYSTPSAGNSMGMAMTHGRVAGKIMAAL
ncbi:MAG: FAD-binding protein [Coriobacteriales bacterium]|jgi:succinate dehydrogenase/fumarate reductase flavoprotein subunit|nr:FAD-binding protein [Coriobacteriales bacterium]